MIERPDIAARRFGTGRSARFQAPADATELLADLDGPDRMAMAFPSVTSADAQAMVARFSTTKRADKDAPESNDFEALRAEINRAFQDGVTATAARWMDAPVGFRERLTQFWWSHFTAIARNLRTRAFVPAYVDEAIRPHLAGRFADMLAAVTLHPLMVLYLDQYASIGPGSSFAQRRAKKGAIPPGLNENFARELLELHTLGVGAAYTQDDVRQLAELLTGIGFSATEGSVFEPNIAEPGTEVVLGRTYGGDPARIEHVRAVLEDLSVHPATARHVSRKIAVHFTSDMPDEGMIDDMAAVWSDTGGDLRSVYQAMLDHPAAWDSFGAKVRQPYDLVLAGARALGVTGDEVRGMQFRLLRAAFGDPMRLMGQTWANAPGPNGWPEPPDAWITPQGMAARIGWAMKVPALLRPDVPEPAEVLRSALGGAADPALVWAVERAESRAEAIGLVLASPDFNRR